MFTATGLVLAVLLGSVGAQFPPPLEGLTVLRSKFHENVTISYKQPGICETTPGVRSYSGYVHLPPNFLDGESQDYPINTFFWFFEARKNPTTAPLAIWLNGGPGGSSLMGLLEENGPCFVAGDSAGTVPNPLSWNNEANMLYLDQPTQVGFSYDVATNCTVEVRSGFDEPPATRPVDLGGADPPPTNWTFRVGTFASQNRSATAGTTRQAAHALWHFAQTWFFEFPYYKPAGGGISIWAESYGGHYGPGFAHFFEEQNERIRNGSSLEDGAHVLHVDTLGIVNGLLDMVVQGEAYVEFPYNNTYGIQVFNDSLHAELSHNWTRPNGCRDQLKACQAELRHRASSSNGGDGTVLVPRALGATAAPPRPDFASVCEVIMPECGAPAIEAYYRLGDDLSRGWYDISHPLRDPFPAPTLYGYLTREDVLGALGVPVNYTGSSSAVADEFEETYDIVRPGFLDDVADLLDMGVAVHLVYGDRDYACSWIGGEKASLAVEYGRAGEFREAGYADLIVEEEEGSVVQKGFTRQVGNFSFSRVFQAGHEVPSYQPQAAYEIFMRATFGRDIATGEVEAVDGGYKTEGPRDTWHVKNVPPEMPAERCYVLKPESCRQDTWETVRDGSALVKDFYVVADSEGERLAEEVQRVIELR